ncbi:MAG: ABC transporter ATP-binding protein [bacterium]
MIQAKNLTKIFTSGEQRIVALDNLTFSVPEGQFLTVTGKSGSGKSTLLYQLGLLDLPSSGEVLIDGVDMVPVSENERTMTRLNDLGYIFQDYAIIPSLTALENTVVPLLMQGYPLPEAEEKAKKALIRVGLGDRMNNLPSQLSGGQQQRVAIARAIGHSPKIIFADEPTANLDSETSDQVIQTFIDLNKEGQTIVMVTHEPEYAKLAHRTITMADGKVLSDVMNKK